MGEWVRAAHVVRTKNLDGGLVCRAADGLPFLLEEGLDVRFVPPSLVGPRGARVAGLSAAGEGLWDVRFEGVCDIDDASRVVGCTCLARAGDVPPVPSTEPFEPMRGCTLVESTVGEVGVIAEVRPGPAQSLLVVRTPSGREVLVPAVDAFLGPVDHEARTVHATLPAGLLELGEG